MCRSTLRTSFATWRRTRRRRSVQRTKLALLMQIRRMLVAISGAVIDPDVVSLAATIARPTKAEIRIVHVIEVPWNLALDAVLETALERGEALLSAAAKVAQSTGVKVEIELLQAREAAAAIVDTARERRSDLIILGMPYRRRLGKVYIGRTVQSVYTRARCAVLAYRQEEPS
ncbi:MAG: hypothetical protein EXR61_00950 [Chloroflexi bacterium]|nr:hypothetical protein [Chloroflexota bacterium]